MSMVGHYYNMKNISEGDKTNLKKTVAKINVYINPMGTATMRESMKTVSGVKCLWRQFMPYVMLADIVAELGDGKYRFANHSIIGPIISGANWADKKVSPKETAKVLWCDTESEMSENASAEFACWEYIMGMTRQGVGREIGIGEQSLA